MKRRLVEGERERRREGVGGREGKGKKQ